MALITQQTLPNDILFEILTLVPLDDLSTCRQTSREIYMMTKDPTFKPRHCVNTNTISGYLIQCSNYWNDVSTYFFISEYPVNCPFESLSILKNRQTTIEAVSQCRGLICCFNVDSGKEQHYVCKPATGQCRAIPNPMRSETVTTAMVANTIGPVEFKIIRFSLRRNTRKIYLACEIFDSRSWTWRRSININKEIFFLGHSFARRTGAVFFCGSVYWLVLNSELKLYLFAFDLKKESWQLIQLPSTHTDFENWWYSKITVRDGKLCYVIVKDTEEVIIWTMERYRQERWRKEVLRFKEEDNRKETWLELYMEYFFYCSKFSSEYGFYLDLWEKFWKEKVKKFDVGDFFKFGVGEFYYQDAFKIESDFTHCECLDLE